MILFFLFHYPTQNQPTTSLFQYKKCMRKITFAEGIFKFLKKEDCPPVLLLPLLPLLLLLANNGLPVPPNDGEPKLVNSSALFLASCIRFRSSFIRVTMTGSLPVYQSMTSKGSNDG